MDFLAIPKKFKGHGKDYLDNILSFYPTFPSETICAQTQQHLDRFMDTKSATLPMSKQLPSTVLTTYSVETPQFQAEPPKTTAFLKKMTLLQKETAENCKLLMTTLTELAEHGCCESL